MNRPTDEEIVKQKWPDAHMGYWKRIGYRLNPNSEELEYKQKFRVFVDEDIPLSDPMDSEEEAWAEIARCIEGEK